MRKSHLNIDDWYGEAAIGYCKGIATFDISKNTKISTYLFSCMLNQVRMVKRKKYLESCSLDEDLGGGLHRIDIIESKTDEIADCEFQSDFQNNYSKLIGLHKKIVNMRLSGMTQREISADLRMSQPSVARNLFKIKSNLVC